MAYDSPFTRNFIKKFEGYTPTPAWDHKQYSVGFGTKWVPGTPIGTQADHEAALDREVSAVDQWIARNVKTQLAPNQRAALTSFGYNLGPGAIQRLLPDIEAGNWDRVGQRMLSFNQASGTVNPGLVKRRHQEAALLLGRELPSDGASAPMAAPIGGAPVAGGPVQIAPQPNKRHSKLADMLMAQAAGAKVSGWGDALRAMGGAALGYSLGDKADTQEKAYQGSLAQALMEAGNDTNAMTSVLLQSGDPELMKAGISARVALQKPQQPLDLDRRAIAAGLQPGTPEYRQYVMNGPEKAAANAGIPAEMGARIGMGDQFLSELPDIKERIKKFSAGDRANLALGRGDAAEVWRRIETGREALVRNLTGAGMAQSEAENAAARYQISSTDTVDTMFSKLDGLEKDLRKVREGAITGKQGTISKEPPPLSDEVLRQRQANPSAAPAVSTPTASAPAAPPPAAIAKLRQNASPEMRKHFNEIFGPGAAEKALGLVPRAQTPGPPAPVQDEVLPFNGMMVP